MEYGTYIHELPDWPEFRYHGDALANQLADVRHRQGLLMGRMEALGFNLQQEAQCNAVAGDVITSSAIEGERLDAAQVRSSVARRLGLDVAGMKPADRHVDGVVEMMLDATQRYDAPLTAARLYAWQAALFPTGRSLLVKIRTGAWRDDASGPMQVVSGPHGREKVHFEAPAARRVKAEMAAFLRWFNARPATDPVLKAGLAHLWFVTVHPFADGNGRVARAIADMALARSEGSPRRFYSMSTQIRAEREAYYRMLERTQRGGTMDVTPWLEWFLACLGRAIEAAQEQLAVVLAKARVWEGLAQANLNARQRLVVNRLLDGFEGSLNTSKWAKLTKTSTDTALRDIQELVEQGVLVRAAGAGGRSTNYLRARAPELLGAGRWAQEGKGNETRKAV